MEVPGVLSLAAHLLSLVDAARHVGDAELGGGEELQVYLLGETSVIARSADQHQHTRGLVAQSALLRGIRGTCSTTRQAPTLL